MALGPTTSAVSMVLGVEGSGGVEDARVEGSGALEAGAGAGAEDAVT